jgi:hypothetical protein
MKLVLVPITALTLLWAFPFQAAAYHFELEEVEGYVSVMVYPGAEVSESFGLGSILTSDYQPDMGSATASTSFQVGGDACRFSGQTSATTISETAPVRGDVRVWYLLRVVAEEGDEDSACVYADWSSGVGGFAGSDVLFWNEEVDAAVHIDGSRRLDMSVDRNGPSRGGSVCIGVVQSNSTIVYSRRECHSSDCLGWTEASLWPFDPDDLGTVSASNSLKLTLVAPGDDPPQVVSICCEGSECGGGGTTTYQYTLRNNSVRAQTLTLFYVGTMDLDSLNYSGWVAPAGFTPTVGDWGTLATAYGASVMATTMVKTPHGSMPPGEASASLGGVLWGGSIEIEPDQAVTFGFNHPYGSVDVEWFAEHPDGVSSSEGSLDEPIAGPMGAFTNGFVHGPGTETVSTESTTLGRIKGLFR